MSGFSGSYAPGDVEFLLTPLTGNAAQALYVAPRDKEALIQQGRRHYSEMISPETAPGPAYMAIFEAALARHGTRMGGEVAGLAQAVARAVSGPITLCSLVRAGVPLGVLLHRALTAMGRDVVHYGISIIRDRGIDAVAMAHILAHRPAAGVLFVDGWTGKGAISDELESTLAGSVVAPRMVVLADPAGRAWLSASHDDWLIPGGILGSTVSGLISRSILNDTVVPDGGFHAAIHLTALADHDVSRRFVDTITVPMLAALAAPPDPRQDPEARARAASVIDAVAAHFGIANRNRIKPGLAEATRAVLRRAPERILVTAEPNGPTAHTDADPDLAGLRHLAQEAGITLQPAHIDLRPYRAITIIADRGGDTSAPMPRRPPHL